MAKIHVHPQTRVQTRELPHLPSCCSRDLCDPKFSIYLPVWAAGSPTFSQISPQGCICQTSGFTCPLQTGTVFPSIRSLVIIAENLDRLFVLEAGSL